MSLKKLNQRIRDKEAKIAVIGLGYVGLPVASTFAQSGFEVIGIDLQEDRVEIINSGQSPIEGKEPGLDGLVAEVIQKGRLRASTDYSELKDSDVVIIDVQTPVDANNVPRYAALRASLEQLGPVLKKGSLVIVESTISPGTMEKLVWPLMEKSSGLKLNEGFYLGNCPERVMPGKLLLNLKSMSRVVGGMTPETAETMLNLYRHIVEGELDATDCTTAELVKTTENAYRDVQIAFANEVALISEAVGGDVWKVRELVNKSPGRHMLYPGAGVGGHCIPKDPWLLAYAARGKDIALRLIPAARAVNDSMPLHVLSMLEDVFRKAGKEIKGSRVLILGFAYLENSDDTRNSPSEVLRDEFSRRGGVAVVHDPFVAEYQGNPIDMAEGCDAAILMVKHSAYLDIDLSKLKASLHTPIVIDGRGFFDPKAVQAAGLDLTSIGVN